MPWWGHVALGLGLIIFATLIYSIGSGSGVRKKRKSEWTITLIFIVLASVYTVLGIASLFSPKILTWIDLYSNTADNVSQIRDIVIFLALHALLAFWFVHELVYKELVKGETSELLPSLLFVIVLLAIYWVWIVRTGRFEHGYKEPFEYLYKLLARFELTILS